MKMLKKFGVGASVLAFALPAMAAPVDLSAITAGVDFSTTIAAVLAVSVLLISLYVALRASAIVERKVRGR